jgi:molybdopterin molybdotransferase
MDFAWLLKAVIQENLRKKPGKIHFSRIKLEYADGKYLARSAGNQDTGFLQTLLQSDALAILPADRTSFSAGEEISVHMLSSCFAGHSAIGRLESDLYSSSPVGAS